MNDPNGVEIYVDDDRKTISPLRRLLMQSTTDALLGFLHGSHLQFVLLKRKTDSYECKIFGEGMLRYRASGISPRAAIADALATFLTNEQTDYHAVLGHASAVAAASRDGEAN